MQYAPVQNFCFWCYNLELFALVWYQVSPKTVNKKRLLVAHSFQWTSKVCDSIGIFLNLFVDCCCEWKGKQRHFIRKLSTEKLDKTFPFEVIVFYGRIFSNYKFLLNNDNLAAAFAFKTIVICFSITSHLHCIVRLVLDEIVFKIDRYTVER